MSGLRRLPLGQAIIALFALAAIGTAFWQLHTANRDVEETSSMVAGTPSHVYRKAGGGAAPVVVVAHGFAGSARLMEPIAQTLARNGYIAVTFDFSGHGGNQNPLTGDITDPEGATHTLMADTARIAAFARPLGDGRLALLGHSMATDVIVRFAESTPDVAATIAISMFSPAVTATEPRNLLVIVGDWEGRLKEEALRVLGLSLGDAPPQERSTHGDPAAGTGRRVAFVPGVEHISVIYSRDAMVEAISWLDATFGISRPGPADVARRGPWIMLMLAALVALARPLASLLPRVPMADPDQADGQMLGWRRLWPALLIPTVATPLLLRVLPTHFLPVLVADYLAVHFAAYGLFTLACLRWLRVPVPPVGRTVQPRLLAAMAGATLFCILGLGWAVDAHFTSLAPTPVRLPLLVPLLAGTLAFFLTDEWLTRHASRARGAALASKLAFLVSLGLAVGLDLERLFFLILIVPVMVPIFVVFGLISGWTYRASGHPFVGGFATAVALAMAIGATFPLLPG